MGRQSKRVDTTGAVWFVPRSFDNRRDPHPFRALLLPMSAAEYQVAAAVVVRDMSRLSGDDSESAMAERIGKTLSDAVIRRKIIGFEGYTQLLSDGTVFTPTNGAEVLDAIYAAGGEELALRDELAAALQDSALLSEGLEKKSATPSGISALPARPSASGGVPSAAESTHKTREAPTLSS